MEFKDIINAAWDMTRKDLPKADPKSPEFIRQYGRYLSKVNADNGGPVPQSEISKAVFALNKTDDKSMLSYLPEAFANEWKYQAGGLKPLVNAASDTFTLGMGPRWQYGHNANDQYLDPSMIRTREIATAIGENAIQLAVPTGVLKGVSTGLKVAPKAIRTGAAAVIKADRAIRNGNKALSIPYSGIKGLILDTNNVDLKKVKTLKDAWPLIATGINIGYGGYADANIIKNNANYQSGRLKDDQWLDLGIHPEDGRKLVATYGKDWMSHVKIDPEAAKDMIWTGSSPHNRQKLRDAAAKNQSKDFKWYHSPAVGYGAGALSGGATGYLLAHLARAGTTGKVISTVGGGTLGAILGRYIQKDMMK